MSPDELIQLTIGTLIAQRAVCEHLIANGIIARAPLMAELLEVERSEGLTLTKWPLQFLCAKLGGEKPPMLPMPSLP